MFEKSRKAPTPCGFCVRLLILFLSAGLKEKVFHPVQRLVPASLVGRGCSS